MTREQFSKKFLRTVKPRTGDSQTKCTACLKIFSSKNRYFHVLHNHVIKRPFGCEFCQMRFFTSFKRINHMTHKHPMNLSCSECKLQFERTITYALHMSERHQIIENISIYDESLDVPNDQLRFTKKSTSVRQMSRYNINYQFIFSFSSYLLIREHQSLDPDNLIDCSSSSSALLTKSKELKCNSCNFEFDSSRSYRSHMRDHGTNTEMKQEPIPSKIKLDEKLTENMIECDLCEKKFNSKFALNAHKKFKHGLNLDGTAINTKRKIDKQMKFDVECEICSFSSFRRDYVEHHNKQVHKGEFHCSLCGRQLSNYNYFLHHMSTHRSESKEEEINYRNGPLKCNLCEKYFK